MHGYLKIRTFLEFRNLHPLNLQIINNELESMESIKKKSKMNKQDYKSKKLRTIMIKGTASVISNVPKCEDGNARLTTVPNGETFI